MKNNHPNLFIIGASKCGTTSLWHMLHLHPDVFMSTPKEPWFFSFSNWKEKLEWYEGLFKDVKDEKIIGEASPIYSETTLIPELPERIYNYNADAKIIFIVREPISRLKSVWRQTQHSGHWHKEVYKTYTDVEVPLMPRKFEKAIFEYPPFIDACKYWTHLNNYQRYFKDDQILVLFFEDLKASPQKAYKDICSFLSITPIENKEMFKKQNDSQGKKMKSPLYLKIKDNKVIYPIARFLGRLIGFKNSPKKSISYKIKLKSSIEKKIKTILKDETNHILSYGNKPSNFWK